MWVLYDEAVAKPMQNAQLKQEVHRINKDLIQTAEDLFQYGKSLIKVYSVWDKQSLPNPEEYSEDEAFYIHRANGLFVYAINFILCHEFAHVEKDHVNAVVSRNVPNDERKLFEKEADARAIELMLDGKNGITDKSIELGILIGFCSMLFFRSTTYGGHHHPDTDSRIKSYLEKLRPKEGDPLWGIAALFLKFWDDQFNLNFVWPKHINDFRELFYNTLTQVESRK